MRRTRNRGRRWASWVSAAAAAGLLLVSGCTGQQEQADVLAGADTTGLPPTAPEGEPDRLTQVPNESLQSVLSGTGDPRLGSVVTVDIAGAVFEPPGELPDDVLAPQEVLDAFLGAGIGTAADVGSTDARLVVARYSNSMRGTSENIDDPDSPVTLPIQDQLVWALLVDGVAPTTRLPLGASMRDLELNRPSQCTFAHVVDAVTGEEVDAFEACGG